MRIFKKKVLQYAVPIALGLCLITQVSWAEKVYVSDLLRITLRTGPSTQNRVISSLRSGQELEVLESKDEWSLVRLLEGEQEHIEGWVMTRFLITRLPWEMQAAALKNENMRLKKNLTSLRKNIRKPQFAKNLSLDNWQKTPLHLKGCKINIMHSKATLPAS